MFVRIITGPKSEKHESVYECHGISLRHTKGERGIDDGVIVTMQGNSGPDRSILLDKSCSRIYLMNDSGKTIDKHVWG